MRLLHEDETSNQIVRSDEMNRCMQDVSRHNIVPLQNCTAILRQDKIIF